MSDREPVREYVEGGGYGAALGVSLEELSEEVARLRLGFREENANPGQALHGGCAASLAVIGAQALTRAALGQASGPWHTAALQIDYLAAAIGEDVTAEARLLRRGKEMCFAAVHVATAEGKPIAHATAAVRGRFGAAPASLRVSAGDHGRSEPGPMGPHIGKMPFTFARGLVVEHMTGGTSRIAVPAREANLDVGGGVHEGAALALLDTTGAMAAWAETGPGRYKASTPALQACFLAPPPREDLVAYGRMLQRDAEMLWSEVEVTGASSRCICARGTVVYRIVT